jgi:hypothetical protein
MFEQAFVLVLLFLWKKEEGERSQKSARFRFTRHNHLADADDYLVTNA